MLLNTSSQTWEIVMFWNTMCCLHLTFWTETTSWTIKSSSSKSVWQGERDWERESEFYFWKQRTNFKAKLRIICKISETIQKLIRNLYQCYNELKLKKIAQRHRWPMPNVAQTWIESDSIRIASCLPNSCATFYSFSSSNCWRSFKLIQWVYIGQIEINR